MQKAPELFPDIFSHWSSMRVFADFHEESQMWFETFGKLLILEKK